MKKLFLAILLFLLMPILVNADSFLCKYELDVASTSAINNNRGYEYETIANTYKNNFMDIKKIEVLKKEKLSTGGGIIAPVDISYYVGSSEVKNLFQDVIPNASTDYHRVNNHLLYTYYFGYDDFYDYITNNSRCPSNLKIYTVSWGTDLPSWVDAAGLICIDDLCDKGEDPVVYKLITQGDPIIDPNNQATKKCTDKNLNCQKVDAVYCRKYFITANDYGSGIVEFGNLDDGSRYYAVIFPGYPVGIAYNTGSNYSVKVDNYTFQIDKSFWDELYIDECNYRDKYLALEESLSNSGGKIAKIVENKSNSGPVVAPEVDVPEIHFCEEARVLRAFKIAGFLLFALKIIVPLIIIILGSIDFAKAVIDTGDKANKEAINMLVKRLIIGIIIFLLPTILDILLGFIDGAKETHDGFSACTHCLFNPFDSTCDKTINDVTGRGVNGNGGSSSYKGGTTVDENGNSHHSGNF